MQDTYNRDTMRYAGRETQRKIRRPASEALLVYDLSTKMPLGQILDMSASGLKLMSEDPIEVNTVYYCRIPLEKKICGRKEIFFDAECRWCVSNDETGWYNSGFILRFPTTEDAETVQRLIYDWMIDQTEKLNAKYRKIKRKEPRFLKRLFRRKAD